MTEAVSPAWSPGCRFSSVGAWCQKANTKCCQSHNILYEHDMEQMQVCPYHPGVQVQEQTNLQTQINWKCKHQPKYQQGFNNFMTENYFHIIYCIDLNIQGLYWDSPYRAYRENE